MLLRFSQVSGLGRFERLQHLKNDALKLRRLSLIYARNASGKTTLTRVLAAAGAGDAADVLVHQRIGHAKPPDVTLEFDGGVARFDGKQWGGHRPRVIVFDREFVEANVYVGRHQRKEQRKGLLRLALGPEDVTLAREIDALAKRGRQIVTELRPHETALRTAARDFDLTVEVFLALPALADPDAERRTVQTQLDEAIKAHEIRMRARPSAFPQPPALDLDLIQILLDTDARRVGDAAQAVVEAHLRDRLRGQGEAWVRRGVELLDGDTCPFCDQSIDGVALVEHYRTRFDDAYGRLIAALDQQVAALERIERWWEDLKRVGGGNLKAFRAWEDVHGVARPDFGSVERGKDVAEVVDALRTALAAKRAQPLERLSSGADLAAVRSRWAAVTEAIVEYDEAIRRNNEQLDAHLAALAGHDPDALRQQLRSIGAAVRRHADDIRLAVEEKARLDTERQNIERDKQTASDRIKQGGEGRLRAFADKVNRHLQVLCADFRIENLGAERVGGDAGVGYTLVVEAGSRSVTSGSEEWFAEVLSDGDRSTVALAVFMSHLEDLAYLADATVVFDDPMTSLDQMRQNATAELITELALRARQVIVLSHHDRFLHLVALDWRRHGQGAGQLVELELERSRRELRLWRHVESEHLRLLKEITEFVDSGHDDKADHIQGEIRKLLESEVRRRWPDLFTSERSALEPVVRLLRDDLAVRRDAGLSVEDVRELDRLCAFGARGNHAQDHLSIDPPDPAEVRSMARRALDWVKS